MNTISTSNKLGKIAREGRHDGNVERNVQVYNSFFQKVSDFLVQFAIGAGGIALVYLIVR